MSAAPPSYQESVGGTYTNYGTNANQPYGTNTNQPYGTTTNQLYGTNQPLPYDPSKGPQGQPYPQAPPQGGYQQQTVVVRQQPQIIVVGGCPACRVGVLEDDFTCLGVCCAVLFFPLGILCCLAMKQQRCSNCGAVFG